MQAALHNEWALRRQGLSVQELYEQLTSEEKYQGVGGALQVKAPNPADQYRISGHVFAQWLSIVYMTFVQASSRAAAYQASVARICAPCDCHTSKPIAHIAGY